MVTIIATAGSNKCGPASAIEINKNNVTTPHAIKLIVLAITYLFFPEYYYVFVSIKPLT